jgi:polysaccharide biosynthesis/export protein
MLVRFENKIIPSKMRLTNHVLASMRGMFFHCPKPLLFAGSLALLSACTSVGPGRKAIEKAPIQSAIQGIQIVEVTDPVARGLQRKNFSGGFAETLGTALPVGMIAGRGDVLEVSIWEAPPAALFGNTVQSGGVIQTSRTTTLPEFLIGPSGSISVPFAGTIKAAGKTLPQIEQEIIARLRGKAHLPQVIVRLVRNATANVTVVGDVKNSTRVALTSKGETLLDVLAAAGGTQQPVDKMTVQISRNGAIQKMALQDVIDQPRQNIILRANDVITAIFQPFSFTVLGASGRNEEIRFEGTGITLAQAMGRLGGLQDNRADPKGIFLFRWEDPELLDVKFDDSVSNNGGRVPVIYQINMKEPAIYFAMQHFDMRNDDVIFIANSPVTEIQRFANIIASTVLPVASLQNSVNF